MLKSSVLTCRVGEQERQLIAQLAMRSQRNQPDTTRLVIAETAAANSVQELTPARLDATKS